jgi:regulator of protease activity HflC (stomatin/prohibitin superfamily)
MEQQITSVMEEKMAENGLLLADFVLRDIDFSEEYAAAVEQKQIAQQQAQQAAYVVEQRKQEAEQARQTAQGQADASVIRSQGEAEARIIQAEAEATALELIAAALQDNPDLLTYQYITKLSPNVQVMYLPTGTPFIFPLPETPSVETTTVP